MAELTFRSPGVGAREIDLSGPSNVVPVGIPAGVIGTAVKGPAFTPVTVATMRDWVAIFGDTDGEKFGPLAVNEWLKNAQALTYVRVLGAGDGTTRTTSGNNTGKVTNAGFVVGSNQIIAAGTEGANPYAVTNGIPGRMHFLGIHMSESAGSTVFSSAGIQTSGENRAHPIIRGLIMAASGVIPMLSSTFGDSAQPSSTVAAAVATAKGAITGTVFINASKQEFVLLLNGHKNTDQYPNVISASFDVDAPNYFANVLNTDPLVMVNAGHYLYTHYDIHPNYAVVTGSGVLSASVDFSAGATGTAENIAFITTGTLAYNSGSTVVPNYENFEDRFANAASPWVISQEFGGNPQNLFKIHALDSGEIGSDLFKISIQNIAKSTTTKDLFGTFDLIVRDFYDNDENLIVLERFNKLSLNPTSERYIARIIGDQNVYFDFDRAAEDQKLVVEGNYPNKSRYIRVEVAGTVENEEVDDTALPVGFRGPLHLVTSGSGILTDLTDDATIGPAGDICQRAVELPIQFREHVYYGVDPKRRVSKDLYWGAQFERKTLLAEPNKSGPVDPTLASYTKYLPSYHTVWRNVVVGNNAGTADSGGVILDSDLFNKNKFTLENVEVRTGSDGVADPKEWLSASYVRAGGIVANAGNKTRALSVSTDFGDLTVRAFAKFTFFVQGGFDGVRIFNSDTKNMTNAAVVREIDDANQGTDDGNTVTAYKKAIEIMGERSEVDIKLLAIPGIRHATVTDLAVTTVEERFDAMYIMDIPERDTVNTVVTASSQNVNVSNTVTDHSNRALDSSFAAAYFPDQIITDPSTNTNVQTPPSVAVLGAFSKNDAVAWPWFAPAGFTRGSLDRVVETTLKLNRNNLDELYDVDINPIVSFPGSGGPIIWGQKTLQSLQSSLDRVNVRRLLIDIRRQVRQIANRFVFEPNRAETLSKFENLVRPRLQRVQELQGVDRFKVQIDTTTTTQADIENNTVRGVIYVQPTRTAEFVQLDFVITNAGADI